MSFKRQRATEEPRGRHPPSRQTKKKHLKKKSKTRILPQKNQECKRLSPVQHARNRQCHVQTHACKQEKQQTTARSFYNHCLFDCASPGPSRESLQVSSHIRCGSCKSAAQLPLQRLHCHYIKQSQSKHRVQSVLHLQESGGNRSTNHRHTSQSDSQ